jgi:hypothetical protein
MTKKRNAPLDYMGHSQPQPKSGVTSYKLGLIIGALAMVVLIVLGSSYFVVAHMLAGPNR